MPEEGAKRGEVTVGIMEDTEGKMYLHVTGDAMFEYIAVWNSQMNLARKEEREKIIEEIEKEFGGWTVEVVNLIKRNGEQDEPSEDN